VPSLSNQNGMDCRWACPPLMGAPAVQAAGNGLCYQVPKAGEPFAKNGSSPELLQVLWVSQLVDRSPARPYTGGRAKSRSSSPHGSTLGDVTWLSPRKRLGSGYRQHGPAPVRHWAELWKRAGVICCKSLGKR